MLILVHLSKKILMNSATERLHPFRVLRNVCKKRLFGKGGTNVYVFSRQKASGNDTQIIEKNHDKQA